MSSQPWAALNAQDFGCGQNKLASGCAASAITSGRNAGGLCVFLDKDKEWVLPVTPWLGWEGCGMDVVYRLISQEEELAEFLFQCEAFFEEDE